MNLAKCHQFVYKMIISLDFSLIFCYFMGELKEMYEK